VGKSWQCGPHDTMVRQPTLASSSPGTATCPNPSCLCVFDIDRTLTGRQEATNCSRNVVTQMEDEGYGGGNATLSALAVEGISSTFCNQCLLGITSAGHGSGPGTQWNNYLLSNVMRGAVHDAFVAEHPIAQTWSYGLSVTSPYILQQPNTKKQRAVELIRRWLQRQSSHVCIPPGHVFFFGDRTENILPFQEKGFNSREISCGSRDASREDGGMIGWCGATPEEIINATGNFLCGGRSSEQDEGSNGTLSGEEAANTTSDQEMVTSS